jgi:recombination protein RecA
MRNKKIVKTIKNFKLTDEQKEILFGTLLGDSHLETRNQGRTYRLKIEHSFRQKEYVDWLYRKFEGWTLTAPVARSRTITFRGQTKTYEGVGFSTLSCGRLRFFAQQFYRQGKKVVPKTIHRWLTPLTLAVWYMDDGSIKSKQHQTVFLNMQGFAESDIKRLQTALENKYGIKTMIRRQKDGLQIYFLSETVEIFLKLIEPFVIPSMRYKLPIAWITSLPKK